MLKSKRYLVSLWTNAGGSTTISITAGTTTVNLTAKSKPIDGWQLMEGSIDLSAVPNNPTTASLVFSGGAAVDDIRIMPADANMQSYVYDYTTHRLMAQLDENHYATLYEYDKEGDLVRVKKETEKGIVTISENRKGFSKQF